MMVFSFCFYTLRKYKHRIPISQQMISIALRDYRKDEMIPKSTLEKTTPIYNISLKLSRSRSLSSNMQNLIGRSLSGFSLVPIIISSGD